MKSQPGGIFKQFGVLKELGCALRRVQSEEMGLLVEVSIGQRLLSAPEGGTHFRVTVSTGSQQLQENSCAQPSAAPRHQGLRTGSWPPEPSR